MAVLVFRDAVVTVDGVDLSDHVQEVSVPTERDKVEVTAMGAVYKVYTPGLQDATLTVKFLQDYAAGEVHATLWPLSTTTTPFIVTVKPTSAAVSATNPKWSMTCLMYNYDPLTASVGEAGTTEVEFSNAAQAGLTMAIA